MMMTGLKTMELNVSSRVYHVLYLQARAPGESRIETPFVQGIITTKFIF